MARRIEARNRGRAPARMEIGSPLPGGKLRRGQRARPAPSALAAAFVAQALYSIEKHYYPRIVRCLHHLSDEEIWWRPNRASNSTGNLVLHLAGNIRQWIGSGLEGKPDVRKRDREFQEQGPLPRQELLALLGREVRAACRALRHLPTASLSSHYQIQGFHVTGLQAVAHVTEHLAYHCGQIIYATKLKEGKDLEFTQLPRLAKKSRNDCQ